MRAAQKVVQAVAVAATKRFLSLALACAWCLSAPLPAAVLPADRADALYHSYDGGGVQVQGPSILVRKQVGQSVSVSANYYVDNISSASIDVMATASPYKESRTQKSVGVDYLHDRTTMSVNYINSEEHDYLAKTASFTLNQDMFGDLTTVTMGYSKGWDVVGMRNDPTFKKDANRQNYRIGLSQVVTKNTLVGLNFETITDDGFLNNPYRAVRYVDPTSPKGYSYQAEVYPQTRTSNAVSVRGMYYLPYRASVHGEFRIYSDSWGIRAKSAEVGYTHPKGDTWTFDVKYRYYTQSNADFYSDLFPYRDAQNFMARDKELAAFKSNTVGLGVSYAFARGGWGFVDSGTVNLSWDHIQFHYEDFRNVLAGGTPGQEPLYGYSANVVQFFVSVWY